ncbi:VapE domain-containing protein, partial [Nostoc sp. NIES-2111]
LRILFGDRWFSDELADIGSKDSAMQAGASWGIEVGELDAMSRAEVSRIKAFFSRSEDKFRPPYGRSVVAVPRQCIFVGTTNAGAYLKDETGARRFWPVAVHHIELNALRSDRHQLWAEAVARYRAKEPWWIVDEEALSQARDAQAARYVSDPWEDRIAAYIAPRESVPIAEIFSDVLSIPVERISTPLNQRVAGILNHLGWERRQRRVSGKPTYLYVRIDP